MIDIIRAMVGAPPKMFEYLEYMFACGLFLVIFGALWNVIIGFSKFLGSK